MSNEKTDVILIGPVRSGKSTIGKLLAERLGLPQVSLDNKRRSYYAEIGYSEETAQSFRRHGGFLALVIYWMHFDAHAIERLLAENHGCVFDFGAGNGISASTESAARIKKALAGYPNVFLVLPSADLQESLKILNERDPEPPRDLSFDLNRFFLSRPDYYELAKHTVYTKDRSPEQTVEEILRLIRR